MYYYCYVMIIKWFNVALRDYGSSDIAEKHIYPAHSTACRGQRLSQRAGGIPLRRYEDAAGGAQLRSPGGFRALEGRGAADGRAGKRHAASGADRAV